MFVRVPITGRRRLRDAIDFERDVLDLHVEACKCIGEIGNAQMNRGDTRAAQIACGQRRSDCAKSAHHLIQRHPETETATEERLEITLSARSEYTGAALEQRRGSEKEPAFGAMKA